MKPKIFFLLMLMTGFIKIACAQTTLVLQPDDIAGKDAEIWSLHPDSNIDNEDFIAAYWTWGAGNYGVLRSLVRFDLSSIPSDAVIFSAKLSLFYNPTSQANGQAGANASYLERVISDWVENAVTWNTQPATTSTNRINLLQSSTSNQNYPDMDVLPMVQFMIAKPDSNFGFMLRLVDETVIYSSMKFSSSNYITPSLRPKLEITYCVTPTPNFTASSTDICKGDCINFTSSVSVPAQTYFWAFEGGNPHTSSAVSPQNICFDTVGDYTATLLVENTSSCQNTITRVNYIRVHQPAQPSITSSGDTLFSTPANTWQWYDSSGAITNAFNQNLVASHSGYYHVCIADAFGCTSCSDSVWLSLIGIDEIENANLLFKIFPNPSKERFIIQNSQFTIKKIEMFDLLNKIVLSEEAINCKSCIMNCALPVGIYFVKIFADEKIYFQKLIIQ